MKKFMPNILLDQNKETSSGGEGNAPIIKGDEPPKEGSVSDNPPAQEDGDKFDELGYEKVTETPAEEKPDKEEGVKDPATGYDKAPEVPKEQPPVEDKTPETKEPAKEGDAFKVTDKGDLLDSEVKGLEEFIAKNKVSKEVAEALVQMKKDEIKQLQADVKASKDEQQKQILKIRNEWYDELKKDPDFGGEKFDHNRHQVDKVLRDFMPNTKKYLTDNPRMLPPYVMKDLASIAKHLFGTKGMPQGDPTTPPKQVEDDDPLAFYS